MATVRDKPRPAVGYDDDFHAWALEQAALVRAHRFEALDIENVAEELEGLAKSQVSELRSRLDTLLVHLLKWEFQPSKRTRSWAGTIARQRSLIPDHLKDNPSLKPRLAELYERAYRTGRPGAVAETDLPMRAFPVENPYTLSQALDHDFWPGPARRAEDEPEA